MSREEERAILLRDGYQCTVIHNPLKEAHDRAVGRRATELAAQIQRLRDAWGGPRRCGVVGSEMVVRDGRAMCPRHAAKFDRGEGSVGEDSSCTVES